MADKYNSTYRVFPSYLGSKEYNAYYDRKEQEARDFAERFSEYEDPNYKPKSIMEQFAIDPNYMDKDQPSLPILKKPGRKLNNFDSSTFKDKKTGKEILPSIPGSESAVSDEAALISAFAKTQADKVRKKTANEKTEADKEKVKTKKEEFVAKDTLLGRIFDKRVRPGEEISNRDKSSAILRNISDNLMERRLVGGKEGTDTLSRILGPSGGIREGLDEIKALETASESKKAAAQDKALERRKTAYEIQKISSEAMKNIAELAKTDFTKATQEAMELAEFENFEPGTQAFDDQVAAILRGAVTEGQANVYAKLMQLQKELAILPKGSPDYIAMEKDIAEMKQRVGGTTLDNSYASDQLIDADGNPKT